MSLRVLLADESSTIKRVMQLALQDFDVEVKAVPIGLDVVEVAKGFKPDIIFADVLLAKRNGYEVSGDIKADSQLKSIPVVLMWSGFMELDERKVQSARPDRRLEKPFDAETLRNLVRELVPRTQDNLISQFLSFPDLPDIEESAPPSAARQTTASDVLTPPPSREDVTADLEEPEDFQSVPLPKIPGSTPDLRQSTRESEPWAHQDLSRFKIPVDEEDLSQDYEMVSDDLTKSSIAISTSTGAGQRASVLEEISLSDLDKLSAPKAPPTKQPPQPPPAKPAPVAPPPSRPAAVKTAPTAESLPSMTSISHERAEQILREQVREVLENIAWKIIPDMAERVVREEIQKLMKDAERL